LNLLEDPHAQAQATTTGQRPSRSDDLVSQCLHRVGARFPDDRSRPCTHNGSNGTFRAQLSIFPKANLVVAAFINRGGESEPAPPLQAVLAVAKRYAVNVGK
jgi:hypothetical protein